MWSLPAGQANDPQHRQIHGLAAELIELRTWERGVEALGRPHGS